MVQPLLPVPFLTIELAHAHFSTIISGNTLNARIFLSSIYNMTNARLLLGTQQSWTFRSHLLEVLWVEVLGVEVLFGEQLPVQTLVALGK
jgi:hypothetical protein